MFSTLSMDYKSVENSGKADSPYDASRSDDQSAGHGGTRRPGNLWTAEAREDMFRRREAGETWETICLDYPKRSRHAMQQQYSMMKKQKAIANGTWTTNRRGRKRRNPGPERWPASAQRKTRWDIDQDDEMSESDGFDDGDSEGMDGSEESGAPAQYRDDSIVSLSNARSCKSDLWDLPTKRQTERPTNWPDEERDGAHEIYEAKTRILSSTHAIPSTTTPPATMLPVTTNGFKAVNQSTPPAPVNGHYEQEPTFATIPRKRRRLSQEPTQSIPAANSMNVIPAQIPNFVPAGVMLDRDDILELLRRGEERANRSNMALDTERSTQRQTFDAAIARANRRACDAQDRVSFMSYEHGDAMKGTRMEFAETLKSKAKEHLEAVAKITRDHDERDLIQSSNIESLARRNAELEKEVDVLRSNRPGREVELEQEIAKLKSQLRASTDGLKQGTAKATTELLSIYGAPTDMGQAGGEGAQKADLKTALKAIGPLRALVNDGVSREFDELFLLIGKLNDKVDDLSHKQIVKDMHEIFEQKNAAERNIKDFHSILKDLSLSVNADLSSSSTTTSPPATSVAAVPVITNGALDLSVEGGPVNGQLSSSTSTSPPFSHHAPVKNAPEAMDLDKPELAKTEVPEKGAVEAASFAAYPHAYGYPAAAKAADEKRGATASPSPHTSLPPHASYTSLTTTSQLPATTTISKASVSPPPAPSATTHAITTPAPTPPPAAAPAPTPTPAAAVVKSETTSCAPSNYPFLGPPRGAAAVMAVGEGSGGESG